MSNNSPEILVPSEVYSQDTAPVVWVTRRRPRYWVHSLLLLATIFTTLVVGARLESNFQRGLPPFALDGSIFPVLWALRGHNLLLGVPFSLTLMLILLAHEMGHIASRHPTSQLSRQLLVMAPNWREPASADAA